MSQRSRFPISTRVLVLALCAFPVLVNAQTGPAPQGVKPPPNKYGSPLDTLMSTHLWTDVPQTKDFVRETHPDPKRLDYTPLTGKDPDRPKPRDAANIEALRAELEQDGARNAGKAKGFADPAAVRPAKKTAKAKTDKKSARKSHASAD